MGVLGPRTHKCENRRQTSLSIRTRLNVLDIGTDVIVRNEEALP